MQEKILNIISEFPNITVSKICLKLGMKFDDVKEEFLDLLKNGYIIEKKEKSTNKFGGTQVYPVYTLGVKARENIKVKTEKTTKTVEIKKKIFVSHSSIDSRIANKFIDNVLVDIIGLNKSKDIFYTSHPKTGVKPRKNFREDIKFNLKNTKVYIALISERFKESEMCLAELGAAWILDLPVFQLAIHPIKKSNCSYVFNVDQAMNLTYKDEMIELIKSINEDLGLPVLKIDENRVSKITKALSTINSSIKNSLNQENKKAIKQNKKKSTNVVSNSEELLFKSFPLISKTNLASKSINPEFLYNEIGTFMIWIDYKGDYTLGNHAYLVAHSGNGGESIMDNEYKYENAWAIRRTTTQKNPKKMSWEFFCTDENCTVNSIKSDRRLSPGKRLFSVSWNRKDDIIKFYIDRILVGTSKFTCWPKFIESSMTIGTWPAYKIHHYINTKVGRIKVLHGIEVSTKQLDQEIKSFQ